MKYEMRKGFTTIEMIVVLSLISILLVSASFSFNAHREKQRDNLRVANVDAIRLALEEYRVVCGTYPRTLDIATSNGCPSGSEYDNFDELGDFILEIPVDPLTGASYPYAGLGATLGAPRCIDFHIGAYLERDNQTFLSQDHDSGPDVSTCQFSVSDFDGNENGSSFIYDFNNATQ